MVEEFNILKELFETKFDSIRIQMDAEFTVLNNRLHSQDVTSARIEAQTSKTNGRVTTLEGHIHTIELDETKHVLNCPQTERLQIIDSKIDIEKAEINARLKELDVDLREYRMLKKYPKVAIGILVFCCLIFVAGTYTTLTKLSSQNKQIDANNSLMLDNNALLKADSVSFEALKKNSKKLDSLLNR